MPPLQQHVRKHMGRLTGWGVYDLDHLPGGAPRRNSADRRLKYARCNTPPSASGARSGALSGEEVRVRIAATEAHGAATAPARAAASSPRQDVPAEAGRCGPSWPLRPDHDLATVVP